MEERGRREKGSVIFVLVYFFVLVFVLVLPVII